MNRRYDKGFSLIEGIIAVSLLTTGLVVFFQILQIGLRYRSQAEQRALASIVANNAIAEVRMWAQRGNNFDDWTPYTNRRYQDPDEPKFTVEIKSEWTTVGSPDTETEQQWPLNEQRLMEQAFRQVEVSVIWQSSSGENRVNVDTLVADGRREWRSLNPIEVVGVPSGSIPQDGTVTFQVRAFDSLDQEIPGLFYVWSVEAIDGNGTVTQNRSGSSVTFHNRYRFEDGNTGFTGGSCRVMATAKYRGLERRGYSGVITLDP